MRPSSASVPSTRSRKSRIQSGIRSVAMSATTMSADGTRLRGEGHPAVLDGDETVPGQGRDRLGVVRLAAGGDEAQCGRPALPERALERALLPQRLVAAAAARARPGKRADAAARDPGEADGRPEIHERLCGRARERRAGSLLDPP